jgi:AraC-like DNA-binding protein
VIPIVSYYFDQKFDKFEMKRCSNTLHAEREHFHQELSIGLIEEGTTLVEFEGVSYNFSKQDLIIIPPRLIHNCNPIDINSWKFTMVYIDYDWFYKIFELKLNRNILLYSKLKQDKFTEIKSYFSSLEDSLNHSTKELFLIEFLKKYLIENNIKLKNLELNSLKKDKIKRLKVYIEKNFNQKITLDELSDISGISKYHLIRNFKKIYKISPLTYQRNLRFNFAKRELKEGKDIAKIAVNLGYYDQSHLTNEFKKFSGTTPNDYRENL